MTLDAMEEEEPVEGGKGRGEPGSDFQSSKRAENQGAGQYDRQGVTVKV